MTTLDAPVEIRYQPFTVSAPDEAAAVLQARFAEDGYLFFPGLLPAEPVLEVRRQVLELCAEAGWLDPEAPLSTLR